MPVDPDFPAVAAEAWRAALLHELGDRPLDRLTWSVDAGVALGPVVTADDVADLLPLRRRLAALLPARAPDLSVWTPETEAGATAMEQAEEAGASPAAQIAAALRDALAGEIVVPLGPNVVLGAALLRALRLVAGRVRVGAGLDPAVRLHARSSRYWMTRAAPHTNLLRATLGATAAFLGRADTVTVRPHDLLSGATEAGARTAANVHALLVHESHLLADASAGAYALDRLTADLARAAWARHTGAAASDETGDTGSAGASGSERAVRSGRLRLVGTNAYASADDRVGAFDPAERPRLAHPFEQARAAVEAARDEHGTPPVALLRFGDAAVSTARATFARGLLATLGLPADETTDLDVAEGARLVVLCSSDDEAATAGREIARQLASSCAPPAVFVAGPENASLRASHVHGFVHARQDALSAARALADAAFDAHGAAGACAL